MFLLPRKVICCIDVTLLSKVAAAGVIPETLLLPKVLDALLIHLFFVCSVQFAFEGSDGFYNNAEFEWWLLEQTQEILLPITMISLQSEHILYTLRRYD